MEQTNKAAQIQATGATAETDWSGDLRRNASQHAAMEDRRRPRRLADVAAGGEHRGNLFQRSWRSLF